MNKQKNTLLDHAQRVIKKSEDQAILSSINSGFSNIDNEVYGLKLGQMYVLGAAVAMGESVFVGQLASQVSDKTGVLYLTFKESTDKLTKRLLSMATSTPFNQVEHQPWSSEIADKMKKALNSFENRKFFIEKPWQFEEKELLDLIQDYIIRNQVQLIIIDDEENLFKSIKKQLNSEKKYRFILRLKMMLRDLDCCSIILKKIKSAKRTQKNPYQLPAVSELQKEYDLAEIVDKIWFLHRIEYYGILKDPFENSTAGRMDIYEMDEDGGYINNFYFKVKNGFTFLEVMEDPSVSGWADDLIEE